MSTGININVSTGEITTYDLPPIPLGEAKLAKWEHVKSKRDAVIDGGVLVDGIGTFDSNLESRVNIAGAVSMAQIALANEQLFSMSWTLADNSVVTLDGSQMIAVGVAVGQHVAAAHENAQGLRLAIEAAEDAEALAAIDTTGGWPS